MHAISSYRGNRPTNKHTNPHTNRQDRLQYTAPLSLARSVINIHNSRFISTDLIICNRQRCLFSVSISACCLLLYRGLSDFRFEAFVEQ